MAVPVASGGCYTNSYDLSCRVWTSACGLSVRGHDAAIIPVLGVERTLCGHDASVAIDPTATLPAQDCCSATRSLITVPQSHKPDVMYPNRRSPGPLGEAMRRRDFIVLMGGAAGVLPLAARAHLPAKKILRVGAVSVTRNSIKNWTAFLRRLADLGYHEGKNFTFDLVPAPNDDDYETGYRTLEGRDPDIIIAPGSEIALKSALAASRTLPIVMIAIDFDPFARGYVTGLARPSGNVTGVSFQQIELAAKRIELVKGAFPNMPGEDLCSGIEWSVDQVASGA